MLKDSENRQIWAIVPAAGIGLRMQSEIPKQYMDLKGKPIIQHTIERLMSVPQLIGIVVSINPDDVFWDQHRPETEKPLLSTYGGDHRDQSVINALRYLEETRDIVPESTWILVHDAVRPCVSRSDIERLIDMVEDSASGGLLASPVRDTMKRASATQTVHETVDREALWHALTPQYFRFDLLLQALEEAQEQNLMITDDSSAMELAGYQPLLVSSSDKNIKITRPEDLSIAERYLEGDVNA